MVETGWGKLVEMQRAQIAKTEERDGEKISNFSYLLSSVEYVTKFTTELSTSIKFYQIGDSNLSNSRKKSEANSRSNFFFHPDNMKNKKRSDDAL